MILLLCNNEVPKIETLVHFPVFLYIVAFFDFIFMMMNDIPTATLPVARICLCGAGWWAQGWHLPQLHRNPVAVIVAIVEPNPQPLSSMASLETTKDSGLEVDGFIVSSTHNTHYEIGKKIIAANKNLLLEKPMTTSVEEAKQLAQLAESNSYNKYFQINHSANWRTQTKKACELIRKGAVGEIRHMICCMGSPLKNLFEDNRSTGWIRLSNGDVSGFGWGQLTHILAWILLVSNLEPVAGFCIMTYSEISGADIFNAGVVQFSNGATLTLSGVATTVPTPLNKRITNTIYGDQGELTYAGFDGDPSSGSLQLCRFDGASVSTSYDNDSEGFLFEDTDPSGLGPESLQTFVKACIGTEGCWEGAPASLGVKVVRVVDALYRSAKSKLLETI